MKTYDSYKNSGIEWIGEIPSHWKVNRLKYHLNYQKGKNPKVLKTINDDRSVVYLSMEYLRGNPKQILYVDDIKNYVQVKEDEILLLWDGSNAGEFIISKKGILSSTMAVLYLKNITQEYSWFYFKHFEFQLKKSTIGMGVPHVNGEELKNGSITIPPPLEQTTIANYLYRKTAEIDELISDKKRLLELYDEEKTSIINQAVTKGINQNVPMKNSGIEWLGEIPKHWDNPNMKYVCQFILDGTHGSFSRVSEGYRLLSVRNIIDGEFVFREDDSKVSKKNFEEISKRFLIQPDDVQLAIVGATLGKVAIVKELSEPIVTQRSIATLRVNKKCLPKYLLYFLRTSNFQSNLWLNAGFSAQPGVYLGTIQNSVIPNPPIEEQQEIIKYIENSIPLINVQINKTKKLIELLKEYRTALISEVVTGKVKVVE